MTLKADPAKCEFLRKAVTNPVRLELDPETEKWANTPIWMKENHDDSIGVRFTYGTMLSEMWIRNAKSSGLLS